MQNMPANTDEVGKSVFIIYPVLYKSSTYSSASRVQETVCLAQAIDLKVMCSEWVLLAKPKAATLFGKGVLSRILDIVCHKSIDLCIVDGVLSAIQQRNLEKILSIKVIDRTALILKIFAARARTFEGKLQVELAALSYQKSRLVRIWTHLERQRGRLGFVGGPGESQLEIDRRLADVRIAKIKRSLERVKRTRDLHRIGRKRVPYPVVALVGYTNAGKSTLFNRLTGCKVYVKDRMFSTLDPTMREIKLPCGTKVMLSDTVGFISSLPHHLVAAFRATLEEVRIADVIVHVRDLEDNQFVNHGQDVESVLGDLHVTDMDKKILEVWNKVDTLSFEQKTSLENFTGHKTPQNGKVILCSALKEQNIDTLLRAIGKAVYNYTRIYEICIPLSAGANIAWIYSNTHILKERYAKKYVWFETEITEERVGRLQKRFPDCICKVKGKNSQRL